MQVDVLSIEGTKTGKQIELPDFIFKREPNDHAIYLAVKQYLAAQRQGTHKVKTRSEVHGSSKKLHKQKGTGGSRKGNLRNPLYKGGGTIFGPKPRSYDFKLNKKVKDLAKASALAHKIKDNSLLVLENVNFDIPKTQKIVQILENLKIQNKKTLFVTALQNDNLFLSTNNLQRVNTNYFSDINTYNITNADVLIFLENVGEIFKEVQQLQEA